MYYTALLVNVGCHSDAHEQAKWFGDDIALKSGKYDHEVRSVRAAAAGMRRLGVGQPAAPPLPRRARIRPLRPPRGRRHDRSPRRDRAGSLGEQLGLPDEVLDALGASYEHVGRPGLAGRARRVSRCRSPRALAQLAEFVEVAHRVGGVAAATGARPTARRQSVRPRARAHRAATMPSVMLAGLEEVDDLGGGDRRRARARAWCSRASGSTRRWQPIANFVDLKSPYTLGHARAVADLAGAAGG